MTEGDRIYTPEDARHIPDQVERVFAYVLLTRNPCLEIDWQPIKIPGENDQSTIPDFFILDSSESDPIGKYVEVTRSIPKDSRLRNKLGVRKQKQFDILTQSGLEFEFIDGSILPQILGGTIEELDPGYVPDTPPAHRSSFSHAKRPPTQNRVLSRRILHSEGYPPPPESK